MVSFNKFEAIKIATHCFYLSPCKFSPISFIYQTRTGDSVKEFGHYLQRKPFCLGTSYFKRKQTHSFWWNCIYTYHVSTFWSLKPPSGGWLTAMMRTWLLFIAIYDVLVCLVDLHWPQNEAYFIPPWLFRGFSLIFTVVLSIGETYSYVYDKRQTSDSNWEFQ